MSLPFFFAWADASETTFGEQHQIGADDIISFRCEQSEGNAATLTIKIKNPRIGLLNATRKQWAWLSYKKGTSVIPLFFGRIIATPSDLKRAIIDLIFVAKPLDFIAQKIAAAELLKVDPYDPIFIDVDKRSDPDTVLEHLAALWDIDRVTLNVSASSLILGDSTEVFTADEVPADSIQTTIGAPPLTSIQVTGKVNWTQSHTGTIGPFNKTFAGYTVSGVVNGWPKSGQKLAGGYSVASASAIDFANLEGRNAVHKTYSYENMQKEHAVGDVMSVHLSWTEFPTGGLVFTSGLQQQAGVVPAQQVVSYGEDGKAFNPYAAIDNDQSTEKSIPLHISYNQKLIAYQVVECSMMLQYDAANTRSETVQFTLKADLQAIVTLPDPSDVTETISLNGSDVGLNIDGPTGADYSGIPIGDTSRNGFFPTDRGQRALRYLIAVGEAHIITRSRPVGISWGCSFDRAIELNCRKAALIYDNDLNGGYAEGKITSYAFWCDGSTLEMKGSVNIQCVIGKNGSSTVSDGVGVYALPGYMQPGYQQMEGKTIAVNVGGISDVTYSIPALQPGGLVYPLTRDQVVVSESIVSDTPVTIQVGEQIPWHSAQVAPPPPVPVYQVFDTFKYELVLKPVTGGNFAATYDVDVSVLNLPKQIDLEANAL